MNREQRRNMTKVLVKKGLTKESAETFIMRLNNTTLNPVEAWEGEQVKLDYNRIVSYPDWKQMRDDYREWVEANKDTIFTVEFDPYKKEKNSSDVNNFVQFVEDTTNPKWLFWAGDLIPLAGQKKPLTEAELKKLEHDNYIDNVVEGLKKTSTLMKN